MIRPVLLASPGAQRRIRQVDVRVGAPSIEAATQLTTDEIAALDADDRLAIERAMRT